MATTNLAIITDAYTILTVISEIDAPTPEQTSKGLEILNDMMANYEADGTTRTGWYPQTSLTAAAPVRDEDFLAIKVLLAQWLGLHYGIPMDADLKEMVDTMVKAVSKRALKYIETDLTGLPFSQGGLFGPGRV